MPLELLVLKKKNRSLRIMIGCLKKIIIIIRISITVSRKICKTKKKHDK